MVSSGVGVRVNMNVGVDVGICVYICPIVHVGLCVLWGGRGLSVDVCMGASMCAFLVLFWMG